MDFELVLKHLLQGFDERGVRYAAIGAFALGALGAPRATRDLDFLVHRADLERVHELMAGFGYKRWLHTENVSLYENDDPRLGFVDFLHAFRPHALAMLARALQRPVLEGRRVMKVLQPEDVIGLKVQAIANDPEKRLAKDKADIEALVEACGGRLEWPRLLEYYELFGMRDAFEELRKRFDHAQ